MPKHKKSQHQKIGDKKIGGKITQNEFYHQQIWLLAKIRIKYMNSNYSYQVMTKSAVFCAKGSLMDCFLSFANSN